MRILNVVGARPNFMKAAPIIEALRERDARERGKGAAGIEQILVHTGQHYEPRMSGDFFRDLGLPAPDVNLGAGSGTHATQTAHIMTRFEEVCLERQPTHVLVVGDVNSTLACALVAAKLGIRVIHVEAGLRSFDRRMPEEINRVLTDALADVLFTTEESANENLRREGIPDHRVHFVGNVMIDTLIKHRRAAEKSRILHDLGLAGTGRPVPYGVLTLHRPAAVDDRDSLEEILSALLVLSRECPFVFPVHPRTRISIESLGFHKLFHWRSAGNGSPPPRDGILAVDPLGYIDFLHLMSSARIVLTDSGGIQEETTILGIPCVTLRDTTERPVTVSHGTNVLAGTSSEGILEKAGAQMERFGDAPGRNGTHPAPPLWDGKAAERIADVLVSEAGGGPSAPSATPVPLRGTEGSLRT